MSNINLDEVREQLRNPVLIDQSREVQGIEDGSASNIESTETFKVFFPDGAATSVTGGQENLKQFQELVKAAQDNVQWLQFGGEE